ncbi:MAG: MFS transporter [Steroidobacteraceae bacterium]
MSKMPAAGSGMAAAGPARTVAWLVLALISIANFGNFYVYDSIGPVADLLQRQRDFTDTQIGILNAIYSLPNIVLILLGGILVDRFGAARMLIWTGLVCLVGTALTAFSPSFAGMAAGRLLFGIGAETFNIATLTAVVKYFSGRNLAFAIGSSLAIGRAGAIAADMSPTWFAGAYAGGWQPPLVIATVLAAASVAAVVLYAWLDRRRGHADAHATTPQRRFSLRDLAGFGPAYWYLLLLCVLWYSVIFAFRSTFAIKYFQHAHGLDLAAAGAINAWVFLAALFATPAFGWLCDRTGRYAPLLAFGALLLPISLAVMAVADASLWVGTVLIGVSFSLVPAVMWPLTAKLVPESRFGTALGLMWVVQNAGMAGANLVAGRLNDLYGASALNPAGYQPMMLYFFLSSALGFVFALLLWRRAGRRHHEALTHTR